MKKVIVSTLILSVFSALSFSQEVVEFDFEGGLQNPLDINVTSGATFNVTTAAPAATSYVVFQNLFGGTPNFSSSTSFSALDLAFDGNTSGFSTGTITGAELTKNDLVVGFGLNVVGIGNRVLGTGHRTTSNSPNINYSGINSSGTVRIADHLGNFIDDGTVTWEATLVPEPSTYALIIGGACLGLVIWKRRLLRISD